MVLHRRVSGMHAWFLGKEKIKRVRLVPGSCVTKKCEASLSQRILLNCFKLEHNSKIFRAYIAQLATMNLGPSTTRILLLSGEAWS